MLSGREGAARKVLPQEASYHMLQQSGGLLLNELGHHVAQDGPDCVESLVGGADVVQAVVVQQDLLDNEDGNGLAELRAGLHDAEAQGDDLGGQQEVDDLGRVVLDQSADHTQGSEAEVFEGSRLGGRVEEWVEEKRDVRWKE